MKKMYFKNLDALRFMAAFAVMGEHITRSFYFPDTPWKNAFIILLSMDGTGAEMGVSFFFVLSGFLISYLLIEEFENTGTLQVKQFYIRRTLRIWPLYFITLFIGFVIHPVLDKSLIELANWKMYATFLTNFDHIYSNWPQSGILGVQWSLAVEEQFYLLWPLLIFMLLPRKRLFPVILIALIGFSLVYKLSGGHKYHTLTCLAPLMTGSLLAYGCYYFPRQVEKFTSRLTRQSTLLIYGLSLGLIFFQYKISQHVIFYHESMFVVFLLFSAFVIVDQNYAQNSFYKFSRLKVLTQLGKMSYGIYLLHMVAITLALYLSSEFDFSFWIWMLVIFSLTIALAFCSYYLVEKPFLNLKSKFTS